jgi:hypothetical protein
MKTVRMIRDYDYTPHPRKTVRFHAGVTYAHVIEAAAREIERAGAGRIVLPDTAGDFYLTRDASHAFPRNRKGK